MANQQVHIGIDLGGTKVFGGLVGSDGSLTDETYVEHGDGAGGGADDLSADERALGLSYVRVCEVVATLTARAHATGRTPVGVGIGAPGTTHPDGVVIAAGALNWKGAPLGPLLQKRTGLPVRVENDVNVAALAEHAVGAGRGARSLFLLAVGTGIGGAVVIDNKLWRGAKFSAGEIGSMLPGPEFLDWSDRDWGAFEGFASGTGIAGEARRVSKESGLSLTEGQLKGERLFAAAAAGEPWARAAIDRAVGLWTVAIAAVQTILDPERIILSGGVATSAAPYLPEIVRRLAIALPNPPTPVISTLGYRAAVLGAPALFNE